MSDLDYGIRAIQPSMDENLPHIFGFAIPRTDPTDTLLEVWNGPTNAAKVLTLYEDGDLAIEGKLYVNQGIHITGSDPGPLGSGLGLVNNLTSGSLSSGVGTILFYGATNRDSVAFLVCYQGGNTYYIPVFDAYTG